MLRSMERRLWNISSSYLSPPRRQNGSKMWRSILRKVRKFAMLGDGGSEVVLLAVYKLLVVVDLCLTL